MEPGDLTMHRSTATEKRRRTTGAARPMRAQAPASQPKPPRRGPGSWRRLGLGKRLACLTVALAAGFTTWCAPYGGARAEDLSASASREYLIKAAFLYNFAKFTEWPAEAYADPSAPLRICVLGDGHLGRALAALEGKQIKGRRVATAHLAKAEDAGTCQVLYIGPSERERLPGILKGLNGRPVLTVTDMPYPDPTNGGIINLKVVAEKIRFQIDKNVAEAAGLDVSSKLLALAEVKTGQSKPHMTAAGGAPEGAKPEGVKKEGASKGASPPNG